MEKETLIYILLAVGLVPLNVRIVFDWLKSNKTKKEDAHCPLNRGGIIAKINWLHEAHSKTDDDGRPKWYFPSSIEPNIAEMVELLKDIKRGINGK